MASGEESKPSEFKHVLAEIQISIQCVDNPNGVNGVVVYDEKTFAMTSEPDTIIEWRDAGDGQGPYRSVRPFHHEDDEPPPERDPHTQIDTKDDGYILNKED